VESYLPCEFGNFSKTHLLGKRCAPFLGASVLGFEAPSCVLRFILVEVFLLKNIANDLAGFSSLVEKGFR
jgi:hypothetical protein